VVPEPVAAAVLVMAAALVRVQAAEEPVTVVPERARAAALAREPAVVAPVTVVQEPAEAARVTVVQELAVEPAAARAPELVAVRRRQSSRISASPSTTRRGRWKAACGRTRSKKAVRVSAASDATQPI
jgi:hypothetical protein